MQEVSELWRVSTSSGKYISEDFSPDEFAGALQLLMSGKALGPDSMCPELIINAGAAMKTWLNTFLIFLDVHTKAFQNLRKSMSSCHPEAE